MWLAQVVLQWEHRRCTMMRGPSRAAASSASSKVSRRCRISSPIVGVGGVLGPESCSQTSSQSTRMGLQFIIV